MNTLNSALMFATASRFDAFSNPPSLSAGSLQVEEYTDADRRAMNFGLNDTTVFALGSGTQLAAFCRELLTDFRGLGIQVQDLALWLRHLPELRRLFSSFFRQAGGRPAVMASHTVCWTDRAVHRHGYGADVATTDVKARAFNPGTTVRLRFEADDPKRLVGVRSAAIEWLAPEGRGTVPTVVKVVESQEKLRGRHALSGSHRESLGRGTGSRDDEPWLVRGLFPGLKGYAYSLIGGAAGEFRLLPLVSPGRVNVSAIQPGEKLIDGVGVLDVYILKAWRFFRRRLFQDAEEVRQDELSLAFHRSGRVAYIAASCHQLAPWSVGVGERFMTEWVRRNGPPTSSRQG